MKRYARRTLALLLSLVLCLGLLPTVALAAEGGDTSYVYPTINYCEIDTAGNLSLSWSYSSEISDWGTYSSSYSFRVSAWAGDASAQPSNVNANWVYYTIAPGDGNASLTESGGNFSASGLSNTLTGGASGTLRLEILKDDEVCGETTTSITVEGSGSSSSTSDWPSVTISGEPTLTVRDYTPYLTVSWTYGSNLSSSDQYAVYAYVWPGTDINRPDSGASLSSRLYNTTSSDTSLSTSGGSFTNLSLLSGGGLTAGGSAMVQIVLTNKDNGQEILTSSTPVQITVQDNSSSGNQNLPTPSNKLPVIEEVTYYDKDYSYLVDYEATYHGMPAVSYMYTEGSNNLEVFALLPAASESAANSARVSGYSGFEVSGQWYSVAGLWTVGGSYSPEAKDDTTRTLMTPLYCDSTPTQGTTLYLALFDYDNGNALSNLVPVTVPGTGQTASGTGAATLAITTGSLPEATVGKSYSATLAGTAANGGALRWSRSSGSLPAGLSLNATTGVISGTPTAAGTSSFEVTLTETGGGTVKKTFSIKVSNPAPKIITTALTQAVKGIPYTVKLQGTASGNGALSWALETGSSLPDGLNLAENGTISGTPGTSLTESLYNFTLKLTEAGVTDAATQQFSLSVRDPYAYKATFALNGGEGSVADVTATENGTDNWQTITLPAAPTRTGYSFGGWKWNGTTYQAGATVTLTANATFTAQWTEPAPVTATYDGQVVGAYDLVGVREDGGTVRLDWGYAGTPIEPELSVNWSSLRNYAFASIDLKGYVDGTYQTIASYSGEPTADFTLTPAGGMTGLKIITDLAATDGTVTLTRGTDFSFSSLRVQVSGSTRYLDLPCMTAQSTGFSVYVYGVSSSEYNTKYKWQTYSGEAITVADNTATVTLDKMPTSFTLSGTVYFGTEESEQADLTPLAGVQVQVTQYVFGRDMSFTATTDKDGKYTIAGLQPRGENIGSSIYYSLLSADGTRMTNNYYTQSFPVGESITGGQTQTHDFYLNTAIASLEVGLDFRDNPNLDATQRNAVRNGSPYTGWIKFSTSGDFSNSTASRVYTGGTAYHYLSGFGAGGEVHYQITGGGLQETSGTFTLANGVYATAYNAPILVKPQAGVVVALSSPTTCDYALAWFNSSGNFVGASDAISAGGYTITYYVPAPGTGPYTVALIPATAAGTLNTASTLNDLGENNLHQWSVTIEANKIVPLADYAISSAQSEDAAFVTKPNSTMTADREAFSSTDDLVRFTGSIGLDSGYTDGKLNGLTINVRNDVDNVSYSNTAPIQYVVLDGKLYAASDFTMSSTGYYYINGLGVDLPCDYTIYCKPGDTDWDMQVNMYANVFYKSGADSKTQNSQLVGAATVKKPGASITTLSSYVCSDTVAVKGTTTANGAIDIYDGETLIGTATANKKGLWEATVPLANAETPKDGITAENCYATTHVLTSRTANGTISDPLYITHDPSGPQLTSFRMGWIKYGSYNEINVGEGYTYAGGMPALTFKATFKNPEKLRATQYGDTGAVKTSKVAFQYYLTNGTVGFIQATSGSGTTADPFTATLPNTICSSVTAADVIYDPILNQRPAKDGVYALTETDLTEFEDDLDELENATLFSDAVDLTYSASAEELTAINGVYTEKSTGITIKDLSVQYNDNTGFLKWMNDSAAEWTGSNREANSGATYRKSVVYARKADYDAQLTQLKTYATRQSDLENEDSKVTGSQLFFTDMKSDDDMNLTGGTYMAEFIAFSDEGRNLYTIYGTLALDYSFNGYATTLPNDVPTLTSATGSGLGEATLMFFWGNDTKDKKDNVSTTEAAIQKNLYPGEFLNMFHQGPPSPIDVYHNLNEAGKEYIETSNQYGMLVTQGKIDGNLIEQSKEWQEIQNAKDYYMERNPIGSQFRQSAYDDEGKIPTPGDRIAQIENDMKALKDLDGSLKELELKLGWESAMGLKGILDFASGITGGDMSIDSLGPLKNLLSTIPNIVLDKMVMDKIQQAMDIYNRLMYNWNYVQNWYNSEIGFGDKRFAPKENNGGGGSSGGGGGGQQNDTGTSSAKRARDIADKSITKKPPITNKVSNDPAGVVFEGVIENPVQGATVTLYYAANGTGDVVLKDDATTATQLLRADDVDDLIPNDPVQITGADGKYSWGVPEGLWYVTAEAGGMTGNSNADTAATVSKDLTLDGSAVSKLLPVLPVQLDVNIPLVDASAPYVDDVVFAEDEGVYVTFSKYMDEATLTSGNFTLTVENTPVALTTELIEKIDQGHYPANLPAPANGTTYTKTVLLKHTALKAGDTVSLKVDHAVESYADTPMGTSPTNDYTTENIVETQTPLAVPSLRVGSETAEAVVSSTVAADYGSALFLTLPDGAPTSAKIVYQIDGGTETTYTAPIVVNSDFTLKFWAEALGYTKSGETTVTVKSGGTAPNLTASSASLSVTAGSSATVTLTLKAANGDAMSGRMINASSSDASVATVTASAVTDAEGKATFTVRGVKAGSASIYFDVENVGATVTVTVSAGSSYTPSSDPVTTDTVKVTGDEEITATPRVSNGTAETTVSAKNVSDALKNAEEGDTLTVKVDTKNADTVAVKLPVQAVKTAADADVDMAVETENGTVKLDADTLDALAKSGKEAAVTVKENKDGTITVDVTSGGETVDANVKVELPVTGEGQTLVIVQPDGTEEIVKKSVVEDGKVYAEIPAGATVKVADNEKTFPDVPKDAWYDDAVEFVASHELFEGTEKGFEPNLTMTRAMLVTVLYRLEGATATGQNPFADVADGTWFTEAVIWANGKGIVEGTDKGFEPDTPVTREQIATILYRYANTLGMDTSGTTSLNAFPDGDKTSDWAREAMQWAVSVGLFEGDENGALNPNNNATRAEVATLLVRMIGLIVK